MKVFPYSFSTADYLVVFGYIGIILYLGLYLSKKKIVTEGKSKESFFLAGRQLTLPLFVATLVATWYGNILGVGEFVYRNGFVAWVCFGLPYYFAAALFAGFIAKKVRNSKAYTIPEQITLAYGKQAGWISSIIVLIITIPAAYILMLGIIVSLFTGWQLWICIITGSVLSLAYLFKGGFKADVLSNVAQFLLMYLGFAVLLFFSALKFGSPFLMFSKLPANHTKIFGGQSWQYILSWFIIALQTFVDPSFHQRCAASKNPDTARRGIFVSIFFWAIFDFLTLMCGLYAKAYINIPDPVMAFPALGENVLGTFWKGLFTISMLSSIMSALDGYSFISAATIGNDLLSPFVRKFDFGKNLTDEFFTRFGLIITAIFAVIMAIVLPSAVQLIYDTASIAVPALLLPLLLSFTGRFRLTGRNSIIMMAASAFGSTVWTLCRHYGGVFPASAGLLFGSVEPMSIGIALSIIFALFFVKINKASV